LLLNENYSDFDDLIQLYDDLIWAEAYYQRFTTKYKNMLIKRCFSMVPSKDTCFSELYNFSETGTTIDKKLREIGNIPYYGTGGITGTTDKHLFDGEYLLFSHDGSSGNVQKHNGKFWCNHHVRVFTFKKNINFKWIYEYLNLFDFSSYTKKNSIPSLGFTTLNKIKIKVPSTEDQEIVVKMIDEINKEESEFNNQVKAIKESIIKLYHCVDQLVNNSSISNIDQTPTQQVETDDESEINQLVVESDTESNNEEEIEIEIKGKIYIKEGTNIYIKNKNGDKGKLYGIWSIKNNKIKKISRTKEIEV
jgi:type I restriction enzyme S subunit